MDEATVPNQNQDIINAFNKRIFNSLKEIFDKYQDLHQLKFNVDVIDQGYKHGFNTFIDEYGYFEINGEVIDFDCDEIEVSKDNIQTDLMNLYDNNDEEENSNTSVAEIVFSYMLLVAGVNLKPNYFIEINRNGLVKLHTNGD